MVFILNFTWNNILELLKYDGSCSMKVFKATIEGSCWKAICIMGKVT